VQLAFKNIEQDAGFDYTGLFLSVLKRAVVLGLSLGAVYYLA
jgi:hypothetical protein